MAAQRRSAWQMVWWVLALSMLPCVALAASSFPAWREHFAGRGLWPDSGLDRLAIGAFFLLTLGGMASALVACLYFRRQLRAGVYPANELERVRTMLSRPFWAGWAVFALVALVVSMILGALRQHVGVLAIFLVWPAQMANYLLRQVAPKAHPAQPSLGLLSPARPGAYPRRRKRI